MLSAQTLLHVVCAGAGLTPAQAQIPNPGGQTPVGNGFRISNPRHWLAASPMSEADRRRERAMSLGVGTDVLLSTPILVIAIWSGSLTLLADAMRACLLTLLELFAYVVMRRIHRGRLPSYQYGSGKIESFLNLLIGIALVLSSIWIFALGVLSMLQPSQPNPLGFAVATATGAVNTTQNAWMFVTYLRARRLGASILIDGQVRTRLLKVVSSASATLAILVSAMFAGRISGRVADLVGSAVVVQMMLWTAYQLIAGALPDLMDRMLDPSLLTLVNHVLLCNFDRVDAIRHVRTRRSGVIKYIEIGIGFSADRRIGEIHGDQPIPEKGAGGPDSRRQGHRGRVGGTALKMAVCSACCSAADAHHLRPDEAMGPVRHAGNDRSWHPLHVARPTGKGSKGADRTPSPHRPATPAICALRSLRA